MLKVSFILCLFIGSVSFASRARLDALQSNHLIDPEFSYLFPTKLLEIPDYFVMQSGSTLATDYKLRPYLALKKSFNQESSDNYAVGLTLGRQSDLADAARMTTNQLLASNYELSANTVDINYSVRELGTSYSINFFYADQNDKLNQLGNHAGTIGFGARLDDFSLFANLGVINQVDDLATGSRLSIDESIMTALVFELDDIHFLLDLSSNRAKRSVSGLQSNDLELLNYKIGMVKNFFNGPEILFYRFNLETQLVKNRVTLSSTREVMLPVTLGFESVWTEAIKIRSSIKQIVVISQTDDIPSGPNTTTAAVGLGFTFDKLVIDGVLEGLIGSAANQTLNGNQFLTGTSITYWY